MVQIIYSNYRYVRAKGGIFFFYHALVVIAFSAFSLAGYTSELDPVPAAASSSSLSELRSQNEKQIEILQYQIEMANEYLAERGQSLAIQIQRHANTLPNYVILLGAGSATVFGSLAAFGAFVRKVMPRRLAMAGVSQQF